MRGPRMNAGPTEPPSDPGASPSDPADPQADHPRGRATDAAADRAQQLSGRLAALGRWRHVQHLAGALVTDHGATVTWAATGADERSDFEIGSVTKGLTGLLLADAVERGEVSLTTTLGELFDLGDAPARSVTLASLATQSSGLPALPRSLAWRGTWDYVRGRNPYREQGEDAVVGELRSARVGRAAPRYSNFGFATLGLALAAATGKTYPELVRSRIFTPLKMTDSYTPTSPDELPSGALQGHSARGAERDAWTMTGYAAAGAVRSTTRDMARLVVALLNGSAPGIAALEPRQDFSRDARIGLAWITTTEPSGRELTWHNGMTGGFSSILMLDRAAGRGAVVLNASSRIVDDVGRGILEPTNT